MGPGKAARAGVNYGHAGCCRSPGCWHLLHVLLPTRLLVLAIEAQKCVESGQEHVGAQLESIATDGSSVAGHGQEIELSMNPQAAAGAFIIGVHLHGGRILPQMCTWQQKLVIGIRLAIPGHVRSSEGQLWGPMLLSYTHAATVAWAGCWCKDGLSIRLGDPFSDQGVS